MLLSMTGFVSKTIELPIKNETVSVTINLKSLNSRFFEATCKMPHALAHLEHGITKKLKTKLRRGSSYCTIYLSSLTPLSGHIHPSLKVVGDYLKSIKKIQSEFGDKYHLEKEISIKDILPLPHVFEQHEESLNQKTSAQLLHEIDILIDDLLVERRKEGTALRKDLELRIKTIKEVFTKLEKRTKAALKERKQKLLENANTIIKNSSTEAKDHQMQLVYSQLDKMDIHEEIVRFKNHIKSLQKCIENKITEKGKKLDFILQELFREINTIAAKCSDSELSNCAIAIKVELEKSREQAQNIV